ncbi:MAG: VWA domain-containing protein [Phycisphaeraceae bacterium]|nr:MAG: VWA domain-containing protein [Phycisphaeraceae bacterium]
MNETARTALDLGGAARLADPAWLHALWLAPAALLLFWIAARARKRALVRLGDSALVGQIARGAGAWRRWIRAWCVAIAVGLVAIALARPQAGQRTHEVEKRGRDLVFVVDVSRSMLARDLAPSRLERVKLWINDLVDDLGGDRVGLVAFAGAPSVQCPLTQDRAFFRLSLDRLSPDSAPMGGTMIGDAIRKVLDDLFELDDQADEPDDSGRFRDIILFTDGDDQESFPVKAAQAAGEHGVRIIAIGVGDPDHGTPIPVAENSQAYIERDNEVVRSRLDTQTLRDIQKAVPGNVFLPVGTGEIDLAEVYRDLIASADQTVLGSSTVTDYEDRSTIFIALALTLLAVESLIAEGRARP